MSRKDFELIAEILARHHASEEMVQAFASELKETNPRFNEQRFMDAAMPLKHTVYVASAWWRECDPFVTVVGNNEKRVEKTIYRVMKDQAIDAYNSSESEDQRKVRDYLDDIGWSGVSTFAFDSIIPENIIRQYEGDAEGRIFHHPDMDYHDYAALRDGDRDAVVYL